MSDGQFMCRLLIGCIAIAAVLMGLTYLLMSASCKAQAKEIGVAWDFDWTVPCMIEVHGKWIPLDNYRIIEK